MGTIAFLSWLLLSPLLFLAGLRSFPAWLSVVCITCVSMLVAAYIWLRKKRPDDAAAFALLGISTLAIAFASGFLGPFVLVPGWACQNTLVFAMHAPRGGKRWATMSIGALAIVVPFVLELAGVLPPSFRFDGGELVLLPRLIDLPKAATLFLLVLGNVAMVFVPSLIVARVRDQALDAQRRLATHLAHLKNLVPETASPKARA
jgi:serine/threonine-protein kinase